MINKKAYIHSKENILQGFIDKEAYHIAFCADENYIPFVGISISSLLKNNSANKNLHFHIFSPYISNIDLDKLKEFKNNNINITLYYLNEKYFDDMQICGHFSKAIYYRLVIPYVLQNLKYILYLDTDTLCISSSFFDIFNIDISNHLFAASFDNLMSENDLKKINLNFNVNLEGKYVNSGVMYINIARWNENKTFENIQSFLANNKLSYPDQDALNIIFYNDILVLSTKYNWIEWNIAKEYDLKNIALIHFVGEFKPWHEAAENEIYNEYIRTSPWKSLILLPPTKTKDYRRFSKRLWKRNHFLKAIKYQLIYLYRKTLRES